MRTDPLESPTEMVSFPYLRAKAGAEAMMTKQNAMMIRFSISSIPFMGGCVCPVPVTRAQLSGQFLYGVSDHAVNSTFFLAGPSVFLQVRGVITPK